MIKNKKMKKNNLIIFLFFISNLVSAQNWQWAKHYGSSDGWNRVGNICKDDSGNVYMTGDFGYPEGYFGSDTLYSSNQSSNMFLLKTNQSGNLVWSKSEFTDQTGGDDIQYDRNSNSIVITGVSGSMTGNYIYLQRENLNGTYMAGFLIGPQGNGEQPSLTIDNNGNIFLLGRFQNNGTIGPFSISAGWFIAKFDSSISCIWAKNMLVYDDNITDVKFFNSSLFIAGMSQHDTVVVDTAHVQNHGYIDNFISRFDTAGNVIWLKTIGGPNWDYGSLIDIDNSGNIFACGVFKDTSYFGNLLLIDANPYSMYLSKWDINGNIIWAKKIPCSSTSSSYYSYARDISTDSNGNSYLIGSFNASVNFGNGFNLTALDSSDMFVARYDSSGTCKGVTTFGGAYGNRIISDGAGDFYAAGIFSGTVQLGTTSLTSYYTSSHIYNLGDIYLAKHDAITNVEARHAPNNQLLIYANPTAGKCNITIPDEFLNEKKLMLSIFDNAGKLIQQKTLEMNEGKILLNLEAEAKGMYNVTLSNGKKSYNGRIVFE